MSQKGLQTRPIISGNFTKQPSSKLYKLNKAKKFPGADDAKTWIVIGLPSKKIEKKIDLITKILLSIDTF